MKKFELPKKALPKNLIILIYISTMISGYVFFFFISSFFTSGVKIQATAINTQIEYEKRNITLLRWEYSAEQELMEVELSIENLSFDTIDDYDFDVAVRPSAKTTIKKIIADRDYVVLQIADIKNNFTEVSLRMSIPGKEKLKLYTNKNEVVRVDNLVVKGKTEYQIALLERNIESNNNQILEIDNIIKEYTGTIEYLKSSIIADEESKKYKTADEIEDINNLISNKNAEIENLENKIETQFKLKDEITLRNQKLQEFINDLKKPLG